MSRLVRIGMVNYINTAPIYEEWKRLSLPGNWQVTEAAPSALNRMLATGALDMGLVSSCEYAARPEKYQILADLSISATGPVGSVFLFSTVAPDQLAGARVLLTGQSETSVALVKIVLEEFYGVQPRYTTGDIFGPTGYRDDIMGIMAIGDDALRLDAEGRFPHRLDLGDAWKRETGLPFVFAVFAVNEDFIAKEPETLRFIHQVLLECRDRGKDRLAEISSQVAPRIPMEAEACYDYLVNIEHNLGHAHRHALETFFRYLIRRREGSDRALPLKIYR